MPLTVACAQIAPIKAEVQQNLDKIAEVALQASTEGADLVLFPEASTTGYFLEGGVFECSLTADELREGLQARLASKLSKPLDLALGYYENAEGQLFNAAAYFEFVAEGPTSRALIGSSSCPLTACSMKSASSPAAGNLASSKQGSAKSASSSVRTSGIASCPL